MFAPSVLAFDSPLQTFQVTLQTTLPVRADVARPSPDEDLMEKLMGHGYFQLRILACAQLCFALTVFHDLSLVTMTADVDHWCKPPPDFPGDDVNVWKNVAIPVRDDGRFSQCAMYGQTTLGRISNRSLVPCDDWSYDLPSGVQTIVSKWNLVCSRSRHLSIALTNQFLGGFVFLPLVGQFADKVGRRPVIFAFVMVGLGAGFISSVASTFTIFVLGRTFVATAVGCLKVTTFILLLEVTTSVYRETYCCLAHVGSLVALFAALTLKGAIIYKQLVSLLTMVPISLLVFAFYAVEESPRWLLFVRNWRDAKKVILIASELNKAAVNLEGFETTHQGKSTPSLGRPRIAVVDLLAMPQLKGRTLVLSCLWFSTVFSLYGVMLTTMEGKISLKLIGLLPTVSAILVAVFVLRVCARKAALSIIIPVSSVLAFFVSASIPLLPYRFSMVLHALTSMAMQVMVIILYMFTFETFPTAIRVTGFSTVYACGRIGAALSPYLQSMAETTHPSMPTLLIAVLALSSRCLLGWIPESKCAKLPDTLHDLDTK